jgi:hypothetical protein
MAMMMTCEICRDQLLDHAYGLLDDADAWPAEAHLRGCPECRAARDRAVGLIASAAKSPHPTVTFTPPAPKSVPAPESLAAGVRTVREAGLRWAVAASLLLSVAAVGGPAARDLAVTAWYRPAFDSSFARYTVANREAERVAAEIAVIQARLTDDLTAARSRHDRAAQDWMKAESLADKARAGRPFTLDVVGPAVAVVGAPNEYTLEVTGANAKPVEFVATVAGPDGKPLYTQSAEGTAATVTLPASVWAKLPAGTAPTLTVTATDANRTAGDGEAATVTETIRLADPLTATMLATDKPLYRPGERVYYRALTLDRTTFAPVDRDPTLRFVIEAPDGQPVPGSAVVGVAKPVRDGLPVLGPDGAPVRGVGTGAFELPATLPGGEYALKVFEADAVTMQPVAGAKPLAVRKFLVNRYTPDKLLKTLELDGRTYGPGASVHAKVTVRDQGKPAKATLTVTAKATVNGKPTNLPLDAAPTATDAAGEAALKFTLPKGDVTDATLSVVVQAGGTVETIAKPVPLATRRLIVEFFPEGGDLVAGVPNRVYFRAATPTGKPADLTGTLSDGTALKTLTDADRPGVNQGMGVFTYTPAAGRADFLALASPAGIEPPTPQGFPLPAVKPTGVVLSVPDGVSKPGDPLRVRLTAVGPAKRTVVVGAYTRGRAMAHARAALEPGTPVDVALDFGPAKLGGVTRVTVFDEPPADADRTELKPVAERLVFRTPGEVLKIAAATQQAPGASFLPGAPVELTITTADETGAPKPAVLWAAVVNQSVLTMADDRSARLLPTHFLLAGEVQKPDELEQADFLLTDHPKAAAALDLVLGTQGWRRFAEQAPGTFKQRIASEDGERLLLAMSGGTRSLAGWSVASIRLADTHRPRYDAAVAEVVAAEAAQRDDGPTKRLGSEWDQHARERNAEIQRLDADGGELAHFQEGVTNRRDWLPLTATVLFGLAILLGLRAAVVSARWQAAERRWLRRGAVGFALLGAFSLAATAATSRRNNPWNQFDFINGSQRSIRPFPSAANAEMEPVEAAFPGGVRPPRPGPPNGQPEGAFRAMNSANATRAATVVLREGVLRTPSGPGSFPAPVGISMEKLREDQRRYGALLRRFDSVRVEGDVPVDPLSRERVRGAISPVPALVVREYANARRTPNADDPASPLTAETVLWQPVLVTPADGRATLKFDLADDATGYRVLVAGHTLDGRLGASVTTIEVRKPFAIDVKLPAEIGSADRLTVPVTLTNATAADVTAGLTATAKNVAPEGLSAATIVPANGGGRALVGLTPTVAEGIAELTITATRPDADSSRPRLVETVRRSVTVVPDGFPIEGVASGLLAKSVTLPLTLPKGWTPGTLHASVVVYPNALAEVQAGLDGLLREPSGCFEQASSANYPNVLVLNLLRETGRASPDASGRAKGLLDRGYAKLVAFECPRDGGDKVGFEWFGTAGRPHDALTAYGLVQFTDMSRVYPVDAKLLARTKQFLLDARDGTGGYRPPATAAHVFGRAPATTVAAYITWAITQAEAKAGDPPSDLAKELDALFARAIDAETREANDPFYLALTASSLLTRNRTADGVKLLEAVAKLQRTTGEVGGTPTSLTPSSGKSLAVEATAAAVLGWFQADRPDLFAAPLRSALAWLNTQRDPSGAFGATQSTVMALKAIAEQARRHKHPAESGEVIVRVAGVEVGRTAFTSAAVGPVVVPVPADALTAGVAGVTVENTTGETYPVSLTWRARTATPAAAAGCPVTLTTSLDRAALTEGDTARVTVVLANPSAQPVGMVMAIVGLPAGLKLPADLKQLKALTERPTAGEPTVSSFELRPREVVLYRHGLAAGESVTVALDAVAETPGTSRGPASRAYPYYAPDHKFWAKPLAATVAPR